MKNQVTEIVNRWYMCVSFSTIPEDDWLRRLTSKFWDRLKPSNYGDIDSSMLNISLDLTEKFKRKKLMENNCWGKIQTYSQRFKTINFGGVGFPSRIFIHWNNSSGRFKCNKHKIESKNHGHFTRNMWPLWPLWPRRVIHSDLGFLNTTHTAPWP